LFVDKKLESLQKIKNSLKIFARRSRTGGEGENDEK
jgi:hypothetical protein